MPRLPDLPGRLVPTRSEEDTWLKNNVSRLCQLSGIRFPGSQPVSFGTKDLDRLENYDYWVCEKSDGIRVLLLILTDLTTTDQTVYIIDRHNDYRQLQGFFFPHYEDVRMPLRSTILDGELLFDVEPETKKETLRFLAFDCLVVDEQNIMQKTLDKRYGRLKEWFYKPYERMLHDHRHMAQSQPFDIKVKEIALSYHVEQVLASIPTLQHGSDGLIYTCVSTPYIPGTDTNILKWKPPSENSIDFKLVLRFPPLESNPRMPDFTEKPFFALHVWEGDEAGQPKYTHYDELCVDDDEWEKLKVSGEQVDDRVVEVHWDQERSVWRMMRFRDDKPRGNHRTVVENIIQTIADGVVKEALIARCTAIRNAWKTRAGQPITAPPQAPPSHPHPHPSLPPRLPPAAPSPTKSHPPPPPPQPPASFQMGGGGGGGPPSPRTVQRAISSVDIRYGPLATSMWSKVSGPAFVAGMKR